MARLDMAKKASQARAHYNRTLCSKVRYSLVTRKLGDHIPASVWDWHLIRNSQSG